MDGSYQKPETASEIAQKIADQGKAWAEAEAVASMLENSRHSVRAQLAIEYLKTSGAVKQSELQAEADSKYTDHLAAMVDARRKANIAKVNFESSKIWSELIRTFEASKRAEMNAFRGG